MNAGLTIALIACALIAGLAVGNLIAHVSVDRILATKSPEERKAIEVRVRARRVLRGER